MNRYLIHTMKRLVLANILLLIVASQGAQRPNIVFFLVDDLGWADIGCYGSPFYETPNIDRLAASGMRFTDAYAAGSVCSPTRASILTGKHPVRVGITDWIPGDSTEGRFHHLDDLDALPLTEVTLAEVLKDAGYQTFFAGKWHLGGKGHWPTDQGFNVNIGGNDKGSPPGGYYAPWQNPTLKANHDGEYLTERLTNEAAHFINTRDTERPFLLYLSYYNVHTPITPYEKRFNHFKDKASRFTEDAQAIAEHEGKTRSRQDNAALASMIAAVDDSVGQLLETLDNQGLSQNTIVVFFSDNGGLSTLKNIGPTCNLPLRAGKGWLYEGGIREPLIIRAPGVTKAATLCKTPVVSMDFFPTLLDLAGLPARPELHRDGASLRPMLEEEKPNRPARDLFWHYPHYHGSTWTPGAAVRSGDWKLIEFYEWDKVELYHLGEDLGERHDLSQERPDKTRELRDKLHAWQRDLGAKMPRER